MLSNVVIKEHDECSKHPGQTLNVSRANLALLALFQPCSLENSSTVDGSFEV